MSEKKGLPVWAWVGFGCLGVVAVLMVLAIGVGVWSLRKARELGESIADPAERRAKALRVLGADELPRDYYAVIAFSVPFVLDVAVLSDEPPDEKGHPPDFGDRGFVYVSFPGFVQQQREMRDFFEGKADDLELLKGQDVDLDLQERVAQGTVQRDEDEMLWVCHRGRVATKEAGGSKQGLVTLLLLDCDDDNRQRVGIWFGPDPSPNTAADELSLAGTVGDPEQVESFMAPLRPCRGS